MRAMTSKWVYGGLICTALFAIGCGGGGAKYTSVPVKPVEEPVTKILQATAVSGELGSGMMEVETGLERLKKSDPAKATILEEGLPGLRAAEGNPEQMKKASGELATKLGG